MLGFAFNKNVHSFFRICYGLNIWFVRLDIHIGIEIEDDAKYWRMIRQTKEQLMNLKSD